LEQMELSSLDARVEGQFSSLSSTFGQSQKKEVRGDEWLRYLLFFFGLFGVQGGAGRGYDAASAAKAELVVVLPAHVLVGRLLAPSTSKAK